MLKKNQILDIFNKTGAILEGHFELSSGLHSNKYLQCALVLQHPEYCTKLCSELGKKFKDEKITAIIAPALGGVIVSYEVARSLGVRSLFSERKDSKMLLRRGFSLSADDRVLVVEDVVTTGKSTLEVVKLVKASGAQLVGIGAIIDRSSSKIEFNARFEALIKIDVPTFKPQECPLCKKGAPITKPGSRKSS